jgi:hypothetical protein
MALASEDEWLLGDVLLDEEFEDGAGGKEDAAKTAEREGLDQLGVWELEHR